MYYAIRTVDDKKINKIITDWEECKIIVLNHNSIYKSFKTQGEAEEYLNITEQDVAANAKGYIPENESVKTVTGRFLFERYKSEQNGFTCNVYQSAGNKRVTCRGYNLPQNSRLLYKFHGKYVTDPKYGHEFEVKNYEIIITDDKEGIVDYLSSGVVKGIGRKKAEAIYKAFGIKTMEVLEKEPHRLQYVKGFSKKSADQAIKQLAETKGAKDITQYLLKFGISQKYAMALYNRFGIRAKEKLRANPYMLCEFQGLTFEDADRVAEDLGVPKNNRERLNYCIFYVLKVNEASGDTGMEWSQFCTRAMRMLGKEVMPQELIDRIIDLKSHGYLTVRRMEVKGKIERFVFTQKAYEREANIAKDILRIKNCESKKIDDVEFKLGRLEKHYGIELDPVQREAVVKAATGSSLLIITGGPGTGKTTAIKMIADLCEADYEDIIFLAPTGRASRRMTEASGRESYTIHSYEKINDIENMEADDEVEIENSLVIIDEFSMTDVYTAEILFRSIKNGNRVIIVGDMNQLPSVGPGAVLRDILTSGVVDSIALMNIHRQSEKDKIVENADKINRGDGDIEEGNDFKILESSSMEDVKNLMVEEYKRYVKEYGVENVMCLCPVKEHTAGVKDMNETLQEIINPPAPDKHQIERTKEIFRENDLVMNLKNTDSASNGDLGFITEIDEFEEEITVQINGKEVKYKSDKLNELTLGYAMTIHKSQGSEADAVVTCFTSYHRNMLYRNLPYVAISRGKKKVSLIGEKSAVREAARTEKANERVTLLSYFLRYYAGEFVPV